MKVLIILEMGPVGPVQRYLVNLCGKAHVKEVKDLVNTSRYSEAAAIVFARGDLEKVVAGNELSHLDADLILSKDTAYWDLTR